MIALYSLLTTMGTLMVLWFVIAFVAYMRVYLRYDKHLHQREALRARLTSLAPTVSPQKPTEVVLRHERIAA